MYNASIILRQNKCKLNLPQIEANKVEIIASGNKYTKKKCKCIIIYLFSRIIKQIL